MGDFGPSHSDPQGLKALFSDGVLPSGWTGEIEWQRPSDRCVFTKGSCSQSSLAVGLFGDSWVVGALAISAKWFCDEHGVFPLPCWDPEIRDRGAYVFCISHDGEVVYVLVDDRLPSMNGKPLGAHCADGDELWAPLAEKAYAKLYGSYDSLQSGFVDDAAQDFAPGRIGEKRKLPRIPDGLPDAKREKAMADAWRAVADMHRTGDVSAARLEAKKADDGAESRFVHVEGRRVGCPEEGLMSTGLVRGMPYPILDFVELPPNQKDPKYSKARCVLLRDPWAGPSGKSWRGRLHDDHEDWSGIDQSRFRQSRNQFHEERPGTTSRKRSGAGDSSFVMLFDDFLEVFNHNFIVTRRSSAALKQDGLWEPGSCGGTPIPLPDRGPMVADDLSWAQNPQYVLVIDPPPPDGYNGSGAIEVPVNIQLVQKDARGPGKKFPFAAHLQELFLCVMRLDRPESPKFTRFDKKRVVRNGGVSLIRRHRQVVVQTSLEPGGYAVVPSTWEMNVRHAFMLRVHCYCDPKYVSLKKLP